MIEILFTRGYRGQTYIEKQTYRIGAMKPDAGEVDQATADALVKGGQARPITPGSSE